MVSNNNILIKFFYLLSKIIATINNFLIYAICTHLKIPIQDEQFQNISIWLIGPEQVLPLQVRMVLGVMFSTLPKAAELEPYHWMLVSAIPKKSLTLLQRMQSGYSKSHRRGCIDIGNRFGELGIVSSFWSRVGLIKDEKYSYTVHIYIYIYIYIYIRGLWSCLAHLVS